MKAVVLTSNSLRHRYFANVISENFELVGLVAEPKFDYFSFQQQKSLLVQEHFRRLERYERKYFGSYGGFPQCPLMEVAVKQINDEQVIRWIQQKNPQYVFLFGTGILNDKWLALYSDKIINLHLGLSPDYKGTATLFWPFANDDLRHLGVTIHIATGQVDAGAILGQIKPDIDIGDNYYDITNKIIRKAIDHFPRLVRAYDQAAIVPVPQKPGAHSRTYRKDQFTEEVLQKVLNKYGNGLK
ncbi:MAG: hypothetical protein A3D87_03420 [Omnitrophica WOR_2 bacterium RIFCSPHIGHO2_02_FULL_50_17]|nr:MAG: hypothetical protein A3D87_03420 [Omnitrophica WOR_2 bacterium RIFCSPHIGHO2_02_FULL_50_17]